MPFAIHLVAIKTRYIHVFYKQSLSELHILHGHQTYANGKAEVSFRTLNFKDTLHNIFQNMLPMGTV